MRRYMLDLNLRIMVIHVLAMAVSFGFQYFICPGNQCSNCEKLSRGAQYNDLKTAFRVRNYITQARGGLCPSSPLHQPQIYFEYHISAK
jgi:hypothetical protein